MIKNYTNIATISYILCVALFASKNTAIAVILENNIFINYSKIFIQKVEYKVHNQFYAKPIFHLHTDSICLTRPILPIDNVKASELSRIN
ncbi:hypothetical protein OCHUTO_0722, partial [Orientia chuto str. Dubai]